MLDPQARALIDLMIERRVPPVHTIPVAEARRLYLERRGFTQPEPPPMSEVRDAVLPGSGVKMRLYRNAPVAPGAAGGAKLPLLVYFHGGGWTIGDLDTHDVLCRQLAVAGACAVLAVDYRLGPESRFPAAVDDCVAATQWARSQAAALGIDAKRIAVGGDSAGGNLAAVTALIERDAGHELAAQILIYPATDMRAVAPSHVSNAQGYLLTSDSIAYYRANYIASEAQWSDWRASPLLAKDLSRLAPALVLTAGFDPLRDEGRQYADALSKAGNRVQYICFERQVHGFITMSRVIDEAETAVELCGAALRRRWRELAG
jgi:acetyl esterase